MVVHAPSAVHSSVRSVRVHTPSSQTSLEEVEDEVPPPREELDAEDDAPAPFACTAVAAPLPPPPPPSPWCFLIASSCCRMAASWCSCAVVFCGCLLPALSTRVLACWCKHKQAARGPPHPREHTNREATVSGVMCSTPAAGQQQKADAEQQRQLGAIQMIGYLTSDTHSARERTCCPDLAFRAAYTTETSGRWGAGADGTAYILSSRFIVATATALPTCSTLTKSSVHSH